MRMILHFIQQQKYLLLGMLFNARKTHASFMVGWTATTIYCNKRHKLFSLFSWDFAFYQTRKNLFLGVFVFFIKAAFKAADRCGCNLKGTSMQSLNGFSKRKPLLFDYTDKKELQKHPYLLATLFRTWKLCAPFQKTQQ